ncbi:hypothetical protein DFJ73DRAFT_783092 [Zopfochytrium polystomum]|nr:hypothetical protein DFJ73DRAFT_783092 [Zopfochytrium polystomum]
MAWTAGSVAGGRGRTGGGDGGGGGGVGAMVARPPPSPPSSVGSSVAFSSPSPHHIAKTQQNSRGFEAALQRPPTLRYDYHHNQHNIKSAAPVTRRVNEEDYVVEDDDSVAIGDNTASTIPSFKGVIVIDANPGNRWNTLAYSAPMKQGITFDNRLFESLAELIRATPSTMRKLRRHSAHWDATLRILLDTKIDADPSLAALLMKTVGWRLLVAPGDYARCGFADEETEASN